MVERINKAVDPKIVDELLKKFTDFRRAYEEEGMKVEEFDFFGPTRRTLRQFLGGYQELAAVVRDFMLPNPDNE